VIVDQQSNIVFVTYKPNTRFDPAVLRDAAEEAGAAFLLMQIVARGRVAEEGDKHYLIAGEDRFLLLEPPESAPPLPPASDTELTVIASVDDSARPVRLKIVQSKPVEPEAPAQ
jgi:sarcosine oxidase gamma subunit